jgi:hypothetical protein
MDMIGRGRALKDLGISLPALIWAYLVGGMLTGALLALLNPLRRVWWGRLASGIIAGTAGGFVLLMALRPEGLLIDKIAGALLFGLSVGGLSGLFWLRR